jgi:hypothetical protein
MNKPEISINPTNPDSNALLLVAAASNAAPEGYQIRVKHKGEPIQPGILLLG